MARPPAGSPPCPTRSPCAHTRQHSAFLSSRARGSRFAVRVEQSDRASKVRIFCKYSGLTCPVLFYYAPAGVPIIEAVERCACLGRASQPTG